MPFELDSYSRFRSTARINFNGVDTFGLWVEPDALKNITSDQYEEITIDITNAGRPDIIATNYYGSSYYYWILIMFNKPINPIGWPKIGDIIKVPLSRYVITLM